ncbi:hypothetical protein CPB83DRAFT_841348 [Crepidotus variabilis]|uniref:Uncharacterized protein n=1 Tax=Crepidotus variabilis TaxID=179855 RepID=A0A9P6BC75_9AGAR|nr:hypothetical protein CPB83DRAFT_841348 [Crepidotus variabilis]
MDNTTLCPTEIVAQILSDSSFATLAIVGARISREMAKIFGENTISIMECVEELGAVIAGTVPLKVMDPDIMAGINPLVVFVLPKGKTQTLIDRLAMTGYIHLMPQQLNYAEKETVVQYIVAADAPHTIDRLKVFDDPAMLPEQVHLVESASLNPMFTVLSSPLSVLTSAISRNTIWCPYPKHLAERMCLVGPSSVRVLKPEPVRDGSIGVDGGSHTIDNRCRYKTRIWLGAPGVGQMLWNSEEKIDSDGLEKYDYRWNPAGLVNRICCAS